MRTRAIALLMLLVAACGSDDSSGAVDMHAPSDLTHGPVCLAIVCQDHCPDTNSHCVATHASDSGGGCTAGQSTCGRPLTGDCNFTAQCLGPNLLGQLFVAAPEGGCGVERIWCPNGCVDSDGGAVAPHCAP